jgi:hypothetical protein
VEEQEVIQVNTVELYARLAGLAFVVSAAAVAGSLAVPVVVSGVYKLADKFHNRKSKKDDTEE